MRRCASRSSSSVFFQAEDGIRDLTVTGVQTCALPICYRDVLEHRPAFHQSEVLEDDADVAPEVGDRIGSQSADVPAEKQNAPLVGLLGGKDRSEERRGGKGSRYQRGRRESRKKGAGRV